MSHVHITHGKTVRQFSQSISDHYTLLQQISGLKLVVAKTFVNAVPYFSSAEKPAEGCHLPSLTFTAAIAPSALISPADFDNVLPDAERRMGLNILLCAGLSQSTQFCRL